MMVCAVSQFKPSRYKLKCLTPSLKKVQKVTENKIEIGPDKVIIDFLSEKVN